MEDWEELKEIVPEGVTMIVGGVAVLIVEFFFLFLLVVLFGGCAKSKLAEDSGDDCGTFVTVTFLAPGIQG